MWYTLAEVALMASTRTGLTYDDLREMPDDGRRYEALEGDLAVSPAPSWTHQRIVARLFKLLQRAEDAGCGVAATAPVDVVLSAATVVQPDLLFISRDRAAIITHENVQGAPDLVVEVLSETTRRRDLGPKLRLYARHGVRWYWAVDPDEQAVRVYTLEEGPYGEPNFVRTGNTLTCPLFPAVRVEVDEMFAG